MRIAQRVMDDIIDLEAEKIEKILEKINNDPEVEEEKRRTSLVEKIKQKRFKDEELACKHNC